MRTLIADDHCVVRRGQSDGERMREHQQAFGRKEELRVAIVSHDLRAPIHAILLGAELLRRRGVGTHEGMIAQRIYNVASRMANLVDRILDAAALQLGARMVLRREAVDLGELCHETVEEFRMGNPGRQIRVAAEKGIRGFWDRLRIAELLSNLVANALQHGDGGSVVVVHGRRRGNDAQIEVINQGPTIPREEMKRLFKPFRRTPGPRALGVGLGLYIVTEIAAAHGGTVEVGSARRTTRFTVTLPLDQREGARNADPGRRRS
jgi:signal transduction histidine kinase